MKNYPVLIFIWIFMMCTTVYADVIFNPLVWMIHDPFLLLLLIAGVCLLSIFLKRILSRRENKR